MNAISLLTCLVQWTTIWLLTGLVARAMIKAAPRFAALTCMTGLLVGATVLTVTSFGGELPRFATFALPNPTTPAQNGSTNKTTLPADAADFYAPGASVEPRPATDSLVSSASLFRYLANHLSLDRSWQMNDVLRAILLAGLVIALARVITALTLSMRIRRRSESLDDQTTEQRLARLCKQQNCAAAVRIKTSDEIHSPAVLPLDRHTILVPRGFQDWPGNAQDAALAHEISHLRHHDATVRLLFTSLGLAMWFHPLVFWLTRLLSLSQEIAADRDAAGQVGGVRHYRRLLAKMTLQHDLHASSPSGSCVAWISKHRVIRRITMLSERNPVTSRFQNCVIAVAFLSAVAGVTGWDVVAQDAPRIASLPKSTAKVVSFQGEHTTPWTQVNNDLGFLVVRPGKIPANPLIQSQLNMLEMIANLSQHDVSIREDVETVMASVHGNVVYNKLAENPFQLMLGGADLQLQLSRPIDWGAIGKSLPWAAFGLDEVAISACQERMVAAGESATLRFSDEPQEDSQVSDKLRAMWQFVDGGAITICVPVDSPSELAAINLTELSNEQSVAVRLLREISAAGLGIDADAIRLSISVNPGFKLEAFQQLVGEMDEAMLSALEADNDLRLLLNQLRDQSPQILSNADGSKTWNYELQSDLATLLIKDVPANDSK